jgi:D-glycero-D-manno-heptose 1,7-bisphosphate phosphatase
VQATLRSDSLTTQNPLCAEFFLANTTKTFYRKMLFLDRDGVINEDLNYVYTQDKTILIEDTIQLLQKATSLEIGISVISNQAGVARGFYTESDLVSYSKWLLDTKLSSLGVRIDSFWYCPSHPEGTIERYRLSCKCRKPGNLLLETARLFHEIQPSRVLFVGDKESDASAASNSGFNYVDVSNTQWLHLIDEFITS